MKKCPTCKKLFEDVFDECPSCAEANFAPAEETPLQRAYRERKQDAAISNADQAVAARRPTGDNVIAGGVVALIIGLLLSIANGTYSEWFYLGLGFANLGILALVAGYIARAISFLPGRDD